MSLKNGTFISIFPYNSFLYQLMKMDQLNLAAFKVPYR